MAGLVRFMVLTTKTRIEYLEYMPSLDITIISLFCGSKLIKSLPTKITTLGTISARSDTVYIVNDL